MRSLNVHSRLSPQVPEVSGGMDDAIRKRQRPIGSTIAKPISGVPPIASTIASTKQAANSNLSLFFFAALSESLVLL